MSNLFAYYSYVRYLKKKKKKNNNEFFSEMGLARFSVNFSFFYICLILQKFCINFESINNVYTEPTGTIVFP